MPRFLVSTTSWVDADSTQEVFVQLVEKPILTIDPTSNVTVEEQEDGEEEAD